MQLAILESEFSPEPISRKLTDLGFAARVSQSSSGRILVSMGGAAVEQLADALAELILSDWLAGYVHQRLLAEHPYLNRDDREYIQLLAGHAYRSRADEMSGGAWAGWQQRIADTVRGVLERSGTVNIRGILRFRMSDFLRFIDQSLADIVEHFLADREYEEFVSMLRVMLEAQPLGAVPLHVYCTDERVWICDESGSLVKDEEIAMAAEQASDEGAVDPEDLAMSILIMRSPCTIVIHDLTRHAAWPSFAETVERVFLDRATRCVACSTCDQLRKSL